MATNLDNELNDALSTAEAEMPAVAKAAPPPPPQKPRARKGNIALLIGLLVMAAGVAALFIVGFKEASIYALPADEVVAQAGQLEGRRLRVEGELVPGTLVKRDSPCEYRFTMQSKGVELPVRFPACIIPDTFRDRPEGGVQVTVEGQLEDGGKTLEAANVMAKCASKYDPATHQMSGLGSAQEGSSTAPAYDVPAATAKPSTSAP
ncbi:MAG: cytochrome c maturation protein CcmE [Polyangiaceae bacterium]|jgi:cytochrome c-type biogenesis protein CcmE|nr:cytochrome c maturation protein CcmE [Polyangiaceae bacterium]MBK8938016.1 cytochrome c maturation protein CcmE [Polyangiaceae bacterium]